MSPDCDSNGPGPVIRQLVSSKAVNGISRNSTMLREGPYEEMGSLVSIDPSSRPPVLIFADKSLQALRNFAVDSSNQLLVRVQCPVRDMQ